MKTQIIYFYLNNTKQVRNKRNGLLENNYQVVKTPIFNNNIDKGERKARTIAKRLNTTLAGGYFNENSKPYDFNSNYKVHICPQNTKIQPYNNKDKYIINLIESGY